tara:strand:+ start:242 stop:535 length:294 start_codon:yes stop_codon:yes gene_type:complete
MSKDKKIEYCSNCGSKHIDFKKYFCSEGCYEFFNNQLNWTVEQVAWKYLHSHISEVLDDPENNIDSYMMSRGFDLVTTHYKELYNRYPSTGEPIPES